MAQVIDELAITIPIQHVKDSVYLVGSSRLNLIVKRDQILVKRGGGAQQFQEYYLMNKRALMRQLVIYMIKSSESLEFVVDCLANGKKIKNTYGGASTSKI
jgi:hypothetical protein